MGRVSQKRYVHGLAKDVSLENYKETIIVSIKDLGIFVVYDHDTGSIDILISTKNPVYLSS
jgi:hypothetical protein